MEVAKVLMVACRPGRCVCAWEHRLFAWQRCYARAGFCAAYLVYFIFHSQSVRGLELHAGYLIRTHSTKRRNPNMHLTCILYMQTLLHGLS